MNEIDELMKKALASKNRDDELALWKKLFELKTWCAIPVGEEMKWRPFIGNIDGVPTYPIFTKGPKAVEFASKHNIKANLGESWKDNPKFAQQNGKNHKPAGAVITFSPGKFVDSSPRYVKGGIQRLLIDDMWEIPMNGLRDLYFHLMNPYDIKELVRQAETEGNVEGIHNLWKAVFAHPKWFFLTSMSGQTGQTFLTRQGNDMVVHVFLSYDLASAKKKEIAQETPTGFLDESAPGGSHDKTRKPASFTQYEVMIQTPESGLAFLNNLMKHGAKGVMFHAANADFGVQVEKLNMIKHHFKL